MTIRLHQGDLPADLATRPQRRDRYRDAGPQPASRPALPGAALRRRRQRRSGADSPARQTRAPNLKRLLADPAVLKIFHFARFDLAILPSTISASSPTPVYCTKIASKLSRTYTDRHGLKDLVRELLGVEHLQAAAVVRTGAPELTDAQQAYAASDVLLSAPAAATSSTPCWRARAHRHGAGLLRLPADPGAARSRRLGRRRTFSRMSSEGRGRRGALNSPPEWGKAEG